jgi:hypothetical protein
VSFSVGVRCVGTPSRSGIGFFRAGAIERARGARAPTESCSCRHAGFSLRETQFLSQFAPRHCECGTASGSILIIDLGAVDELMSRLPSPPLDQPAKPIGHPFYRGEGVCRTAERRGAVVSHSSIKGI